MLKPCKTNKYGCLFVTHRKRRELATYYDVCPDPVRKPSNVGNRGRLPRRSQNLSETFLCTGYKTFPCTGDKVLFAFSAPPTGDRVGRVPLARGLAGRRLLVGSGAVAAIVAEGCFSSLSLSIPLSLSPSFPLSISPSLPLPTLTLSLSPSLSLSLNLCLSSKSGAQLSQIRKIRPSQVCHHTVSFQKFNTLRNVWTTLDGALYLYVCHILYVYSTGSKKTARRFTRAFMNMFPRRDGTTRVPGCYPEEEPEVKRR